jgi:hypothetical protein
MRCKRKRLELLLVLITLISSAGCTAQEVTTSATELIGDLARQVLTWWLL